MTLLAWLGCGLLTAFVLCAEAWAVWIAGIFEAHEQRLRAQRSQAAQRNRTRAKNG